MAVKTEFLIIISKQYQGDKWWEQRESKPSSSSLSQSKISMYTSAVFLGKKQNKNKKNGRIIIIILTVIITKEMFSMKNYQDQRMDITKNPIWVFTRKWQCVMKTPTDLTFKLSRVKIYHYNNIKMKSRRQVMRIKKSIN